MSCCTQDTLAVHLSVVEVAGYLDGLLSGVTQERVEAHLVACERCLEDLVGAARVLRAQGYWESTAG